MDDDFVNVTVLFMAAYSLALADAFWGYFDSK